MKYINTILFALLFIAVGMIYYLHFKSHENKSSDPSQIRMPEKNNIAYVNIDTLLPQFEMYKDIQAGLAKKQSDLESNFAMKYKSFEKNVNDVQKRLADPTEIITQIQKEQIDQQLTKQRMDLENLQNSYMTQLQQEGIIANRTIIGYIMNYLKDYTKGRGIQYIFSYGFGGNILYTDSTLDITNEILFGLNEKYLKEKSLKK